MMLQDVMVLSDNEEQDGVMSTSPNLINNEDTSYDSIIPYAYGEAPSLHDLTPLKKSFVNEMLYAKRTGNKIITAQMGKSRCTQMHCGHYVLTHG